MKNKHPTPEELIAYCDTRTGDEESAGRVKVHLEEGCPRCEKEIEKLRLLIGDIEATALFAAPEELKARVVERITRFSPDDQIDRILAELVHDSRLEDPALVGERDVSTGCRRLVFRAAEYEVFLRLTDSGDRTAEVSGQTMKGTRLTSDLEGLKVELLEEGGEFLTETDNLGAFRFESVPHGSYTLRLTAGEKRIDTPGFDIDFS